MINVFINYISSYLPEKVVTNIELAESGVYTAEQITNKIGISKRFVASDNEFVSDLAIKVSTKLFTDYNVDKDTIDMIIFCTQSPDYLIPGPEYILHKELNLPSNCKAISYNSGCSGYLYGLNLAYAYIYSCQANKILLITSETYSKHISSNDIGNRSIFGDGATASIISNQNLGLSYKFNNFLFYSDGNGFDKIINRGSALGSNSSFQRFEMIGSDVYLFASTIVVDLIKEYFDKNRIEKDSIDLFVFHQASKLVLDSLQKKLKIPDHKFLRDIENVGNTVSNTIPISLSNYFSTNTSSKPNRILICGFGVGLSIGITILEI